MTADVRKQSAQVADMAKSWGLIDDLMGGTAAMRRAGKAHLPQWPAEDSKSYDARLKTAVLFPAYARTVSVLTGKPFSKPLTLHEDIPSRIGEMLDNVDLQGRNLHAFAADLAQEAMAYGLCGILVDHPPNPGARSVADERAAGVRPYFVAIKHGAILGWRDKSIGGARVLTQLRLLECVEEEDGLFGTKTVEQVRVLEPGKWTIWRKGPVSAAGLETWAVYDEGMTTIQEIPFVPIYGLRKDFMVGEPPMMELAHANVEHWQSSSDQQTILHVARVPILYVRDGADVQVVIGAGSFVKSSSTEGDMKYVEHSGAAIEAGRLSLLDLEHRMRQIGAELLVIKPGNTTVVQTLADNEQGMCDLQRIMQALENGIDKALDLMAAWIGEKDGGTVTIYSDFGAATLAEASAELLVKMNAAGQLSFVTLLQELKRRGVLSSDIDVDAEIKTARAEAPPKTVEEQVRV